MWDTLGGSHRRTHLVETPGEHPLKTHEDILKDTLEDITRRLWKSLLEHTTKGLWRTLLEKPMEVTHTPWRASIWYL
jgi:hypothetical protein